MAGQVINGGDLMLFIDGKSIAFATSHKLSINVETVETTSKDSGGKWVAKAARKISWNCSTENLYSNDGEGMTFDQLFDKLTARTPIKAVFCLEKEYSTKKDEVPEGDGCQLLLELIRVMLLLQHLKLMHLMEIMQHLQLHLKVLEHLQRQHNYKPLYL